MYKTVKERRTDKGRTCFQAQKRTHCYFTVKGNEVSGVLTVVLNNKGENGIVWLKAGIKCSNCL
jgi:hypothetical protein